MMGSTQAIAIFDPQKRAWDQFGIDPFSDPFLIPRKRVVDPDQDQLGFSPTPPIIRDRWSLIPDPLLKCYRVISGRMVSGVVPPHTSHHRVPLASEYPGLPSATLIRYDQHKARNEGRKN